MKKIHIFAILFIAVQAINIPVKAINKCTINGKTSYQDEPCPTGANQSSVAKPPTPANITKTNNSNEDAAAKNKLAEYRSNIELSAAVASGTPMIGMTIVQINEALGGAPNAINTGNYEGRLSNQYVYRNRQGKDWYAYTIDAKPVHSLQSSTSISTSAQKASKPCPSNHEIKDAVTSASSIQLSETEKTERWKAIKEMQSCGKS